MNVKQLVILCYISLLPSFLVAETFGIVVNTGKTPLNVRTTPGGTLTGNTLQYGDVVKILNKRSDFWYKIEYHEGLIGYSFGNDGKYISILPYEHYNSCVEVVIDSLNVRNGPAYNDRKNRTHQYFRVINEIAEGSVLQVLGRIAYKDRQGDDVVWLRIQDANMQTGHYIRGSSKYVLPIKCQNDFNSDNYDESEEVPSEYRRKNVENSSEETFSDCHKKANIEYFDCINNICKATSLDDKELENCKYACAGKRTANKEECNYIYRNN